MADGAPSNDMREHEQPGTIAEHPLLPVYFYVNKHLVKPYVSGWSDNVMNVQYSKDLRLDGGG